MNMLYLILFRYVEDENEEVLNPYGGDIIILMTKILK